MRAAGRESLRFAQGDTQGALECRLTKRDLVGADDFEVLVDEDVVWPVDADVVDFVFAVAQLHHAVDDPAG